jgi:hypothetical protein
VFDQEGWPDVVILLDTSGSMGTEDEIADPAARAKAEELARLAGLPSQARRDAVRRENEERAKLGLAPLPLPAGPTRLELAHALLTRKGADWLDRLLNEKQVRVHLLTVDEVTRELAADLREPAAAERAREELAKLPELLMADEAGKLTASRRLGNESRLGDGVKEVLRRFKGGSLAAVIMVTDGVTTAGDELPKAAREAARDGVPLYLIGMGDPRQSPDLALSTLEVEDVVTKGDRLVFQARLTARGSVPPGQVPVVLYEKVGDKLIERARPWVTPDPSGNPVPVTVTHTPTEAGEKVFVLEVPAVEGEKERENNRLERAVLVTEPRPVRVLFIEGRPRYDFRFAKVLFEREAEAGGGRAVEFRTVLLDASPGWAATDKSAEPLKLRKGELPTRTELFEFDVVVLGDFDPKQTLRSPNEALRDLADFVRTEGKGLLVLAGEHFNPAAFADTPLADVLPVVPSDAPPRRTPDDHPITDGYRPRLTPIGQRHPLFRFAPDDAESARVWSRLPPLLWYAKGYTRKLTATVLAAHPDRPAEGEFAGEAHPLVLQQFVGAGRVLFVGFDETWRWRFRVDEDRDRAATPFNSFWVQAVRGLARSRVERVRLKLDKQTAYRRDERVVVSAEFPADAPDPGPNTAVRVLVQRSPLPGAPTAGGTETQTLALARVEGAPVPTYRAALPRTPEGVYRFVLTDPGVPGEPPRAEAKVLPPPSELDQLEMNAADLSAAATVSNGGFYTLASADRVLDDLKNLDRIPLNQAGPPLPLWNQPATFGLLLALLAAEWLLRKRERLL